HLPIPAYDIVIKASHAFNLLEARGVLSTTERTGYISRIRDLSRLIAKEYIAMRKDQGFPLLKSSLKKPKPSLPPSEIPHDFDPNKAEDFLLEIGSEELPATFVQSGLDELQKHMKLLLKEEGLSYQSIEIFGTPRRLAIIIRNLSHGTQVQTILKKGPSVTSAFDAEGNPTKQGSGFLKSIGEKDCNLENIKSRKIPNLEIVEIKGVSYLHATLKIQEKSTVCIFQKALPKLILKLHFPKKMRWSDLDISYARPLSWCVALFGDQVIPFEIGGITSSNMSRGHAQRDPAPIKITNPSSYVSQLKDHFVLVDIKERKQTILKQLDAIEKKISCTALQKDVVINQVLHLSEFPELVDCDFEEKYLFAPKEVLISEMVHHQKYFPLINNEGKLINKFIITADNKVTEEILKGNQKVLSARLADGAFLYEIDLKRPLDSFNEMLKEIVFQKKLGSLFDKVIKIAKFAELLSIELKFGDLKKIARSALLCKADLATALVGEFPELQGTVGKYYATAQKEEAEVGMAIEEHYLPKSEKGVLPKTETGIILSLADKLDNLLSYFSIGLLPTSSSDPYALRRQTIGILKIIIDNRFSINLAKIFEKGCTFSSANNPAIIPEIILFIRSRLKNVLETYGFNKDEIEASLSATLTSPYDEYCKVKALHEFRKSNQNFDKLKEVYKRAKGQASPASPKTLNPSLFKTPEEKNLYSQMVDMKKEWDQSIEQKNYHASFTLLAKLQEPLANLFDNVKILADDEEIKNNRIALLSHVLAHFTPLCDFDKIQLS
ncbi:MAG: glycine--tRNA ligase subunit beta, partial [Simkaniaceae bacterium]|nr:glycine--tRNA ligase subunit beta [Simkaniaceae bacterium]